jgi:hypothetical protein
VSEAVEGSLFTPMPIVLGSCPSIAAPNALTSPKSLLQSGAMTAILTDQKLIDFSGEHLLHELSMFWELAEILPLRKEGTTEYVALIESFATHLRNLIEFFSFQ